MTVQKGRCAAMELGCVARFAFDNGIALNSCMTFETLGGAVCASVSGARVTLKLAPVSLEEGSCRRAYRCGR